MNKQVQEMINGNFFLDMFLCSTKVVKKMINMFIFFCTCFGFCFDSKPQETVFDFLGLALKIFGQQFCKPGFHGFQNDF